MSNNNEIYIKTLLELLESDKKAVMLYITISLAIPVLTFKEMIFERYIGAQLPIENKLLFIKWLLTS